MKNVSSNSDYTAAKGGEPQNRRGGCVKKKGISQLNERDVIKAAERQGRDLTTKGVYKEKKEEKEKI